MAEQQEFERAVRQLIGEKVEVSLARVLAVVPNPSGPLLPPLLQIEFLPDGRRADARAIYPGAGLLKGLFLGYSPGDEVICLCVDGDPMRSVVIGGLGNLTTPVPTSVDLVLGGVVVMHPLGVELRSADVIPSEGIVKGGMLSPFENWVGALELFMFTTSTATTAGAIALAAAAFMVTVGKIGAAPSPFSAQLTASGTQPGGGPPFASLLNKVTD